MSTTETKDLVAAFCKAVAELKNPGFDSTNPHFRNKFASLATVRNTIVPVLAKHGLSIIQNLTTIEEKVACETIVLHTSGQMLSLGPLALPATKADAQGFGSAATYARRYSLMAVAGVVGDEDDDAEGSVNRGVEQQTPAERSKHTKSVNEYSKRVLDALNLDMDSAAVSIMNEAKEIDENFVADIWHTFSTPVKNRLRALQSSNG